MPSGKWPADFELRAQYRHRTRGFSALKLDTEELFLEIDNNIYAWIPTFLQKGFAPFKEEWETVRRHFEKLWEFFLA